MFNLVFTRNLLITAILLTLASIGLDEVRNLPETAAKQQIFSPIGSGMKMAVAVKAQQIPHR